MDSSEAGGRPMGIDEIATFLGVPLEAVELWERRGELPADGATVKCSPAWTRRAVVEWAIATGRVRVPDEPR